ncbi:MAG: D-2-hydroxyacid dehydrogenase [Clostridia bacterium]|nr:D-2-hydroxyacid dehydrogenase [Clostridia bacterium]
MKITVIMPYDEPSRAKLRAACPEDEIVFAYDTTLPYDAKQKFDETYLPDVLSSDIILGQPPVDALKDADKLGLLVLSMAGTEPYSLPGKLPAGVRLCNSSGAYGRAIGEHMLASAMMLSKKLHLYRDQMPKGAWVDRGSVTSICDMKVLIVGLGDIGIHFGRLCKAMGAFVAGVRRSGKTKPDFIDALYPREALDDILPGYDLVALCLPGNPETAGLFGAERIALMKQGSILLNVGRGSAVDSMALYDALTSGHLAGAAVDVTDPEPLPSDHPLWQAENCLITPHISGFYHLRKTYDNIVDIAIENIRRYKAGEALLTEVDLGTGYRVTQQY